MRFRKKPVEIEAWQWRGQGPSAYPDWLMAIKPERIKDGRTICALLIPTLEGKMWARRQDWIIRGVKGEVYPCKPDIFWETYERC